jgi:hypothetical protein
MRNNQYFEFWSQTFEVIIFTQTFNFGHDRRYLTNSTHPFIAVHSWVTCAMNRQIFHKISSSIIKRYRGLTGVQYRIQIQDLSNIRVFSCISQSSNSRGIVTFESPKSFQKCMLLNTGMDWWNHRGNVLLCIHSRCVTIQWFHSKATRQINSLAIWAMI